MAQRNSKYEETCIAAPALAFSPRSVNSVHKAGIEEQYIEVVSKIPRVPCRECWPNLWVLSWTEVIIGGKQALQLCAQMPMLSHHRALISPDCFLCANGCGAATCL